MNQIEEACWTFMD